MKLSEFCIARPVFSTVINIILVVIGLLSFFNLTVRGYPNISVPVVTVQTDYTGASASVVEQQITTPIENQLAGISGIDNMHSSSEQGRSKVVVKFKAAVGLDQAADNIRNLLGGRFLRKLPAGVDTPLVSKRDPNAQEVLMLSLQDSKMSMIELSDYANRYLLPEIQQVYGVSDVQVRNYQPYAMLIRLDPFKMAAQNVVVGDLTHVLSTQNVNLAGGNIITPDREYNVFSEGRLKSAAAFNNLVLRDKDGYMLRLGDVAHAHIGTPRQEGSMRVDGKEALGLSVYAESEANPVAVSAQVKKLLKRFDSSLPEGMSLRLIYDHATFLREALTAVYKDLLIAIFLVVLVVYLFLVRWRAALIPIITIPICVISVFTYIYVAGYSINIFTLLALVLAIGLVVDDAIVMLENIVRHIENGLPPLQAAFKGSREIGFAVIAMTITLAAVFAPIGFAKGMTGTIFRQFAFTLAAAVLISGFVALTLSPMMCGWMLKKEDKPSAAYRLLHGFFARLAAGYERLLHRILQHRLWVVAFLVALCGYGVWSYSQLSSTLVPAEDMGIFLVKVTPPTNASFPYVDKYTKKVEQLLRSYPQVDHIIMYSQARHGGFGIVTLAPWQHRSVAVGQIMHHLMRDTRQRMPGVKVSAFSPGTIGGGGKGGASIRMSIVSNQSFEDLHRTVLKFMAQVDQLDSVVQVTEGLQLDSLQYDVQVRRDLAAALGVDPQDVSHTIQTMLGGTKSTVFNWQGKDYDVILQAPYAMRGNINILNHMYVRSNLDKMINIGSLAKVSHQVLPASLPHQDRMRADMVEVQIAQGYSMGQVVRQLKNIAQQQLPQDYSYRFRGMARDMLQAYGTQVLTFIMALVFIYLVLCAQFESFIDPLIILLSVPLAVMGAIVTLYWTGHDLSIYATIGFVTLIGLVAKHGILITSFANTERMRGLDIHSAVVRAASMRLRPILMTTLAMVIGAVPLALARGANANGLQPMGWVIVGGLTIGTFFSLIIVPVAYSYFARWRQIKPTPVVDEEI